MIFESNCYNILLVSSSEKFNESLLPVITQYSSDIYYAHSIAAAQVKMLENDFDFVIINSPLPDDTGIKFAIDTCNNKSTVCLLFVSADMFDEINLRVTSYGVFTISKPISSSTVSYALRWMSATNERLCKLEKKSVSIEEKMDEIRLVNQAKWLLIQNLSMTEPEAHRYIEKQAMDTCVSKRKVAHDIIKMYK